MSTTDLSVADPRQLLELRLRRACWPSPFSSFGVAALFIGLFIALGAAFTFTGLMALALGVFFLCSGFFTWWQASSG